MIRERIARYPTLVAVILITISSFTVSAHAATDCSQLPGARPATAEDAAVKIGLIKIGTCYNPNDVGVSQNSSEAKQYLTTLGRPGRCGTANPDAFQKLNDTFATCAATFFKAYTAKYGSVYITSAYRSPGPGGSNRCAGGVEGSNHTRGVAVDVHPTNGSYSSMWNFANSNPQFGVCFPMQNADLGNKVDRPHMILGGLGGSEGSLCARRGITKPCNGLAVPSSFPPVGSDPSSPGGGTPSSGIANALRNFFSPQAAPPPMQQYQQPQYIPPPSQYTTQPPPPPIDPGSTQTGVPTSGTGAIDTGVTQSSSQTSDQASQNFNGLYGTTSGNSNVNVNDSSAIDFINSLANSISPTGTSSNSNASTSIPASLNPDLYDEGTQNTNVNNINIVVNLKGATGTHPAVSGISPAEVAMNAPQTFPIPLESGNGSTYSPQQISFIQKILAQLKGALQLLLTKLQPFGGRVFAPHMMME